MRIIKEGRVVFESGRIVEISSFQVDGTIIELQNYVLKNYHFDGWAAATASEPT